MNRLILFLIRKKLGLKLYEPFYFINQVDYSDYYMFGKYTVIKVATMVDTEERKLKRVSDSSISLNYLLSYECKQQLRRKYD